MNTEPVFWTPNPFEHLVNRVVPRTCITENFTKAIAKLDEDTLLHRTYACQILKPLFENSKIKDFYDSPEELMRNMEEIQSFPDNAQFLGFSIDELNYLSKFQEMVDQEGIRFCSKIEAFQHFLNLVIEIDCQRDLIVLSFVKRLSRRMRSSFELIPIDLFRERINVELSKAVRNPAGIESIPENIKNIDDFCQFFEELYDKTYDEQLLKKLKFYLKKKNSTNPFTSDPQDYLGMYNLHFTWKNALETSFGVFESSSHWFQRRYPVLRVFELDNDRFIMLKELENVLEVVMINKTVPRGLFQSETANDRQLGIVKAIEFRDLEMILKILKVSIDDIHIINYKVCQTSSNDTPVPINTPFGTYCTLAKHAFWSVFQRIIREIGPAKDYKLFFEWFSQFSDVFDDSLEHRYFIETSKTDEIIERAYEEIIGKIPTIKIDKWENFDVIKNRFLDQNPKFINFIIRQKYCVRPGRFFDLAEKMRNMKSEADTLVDKKVDILAKHEKIFRSLLPTIPFDSFIERNAFQTKLVLEMAKVCDVGCPTAGPPINVQMLEFQKRFLEIEDRNGKEFIKRRRIPLEKASYSPSEKYEMESMERIMSEINEKASHQMEILKSRGKTTSFVECMVKQAEKKLESLPKGHRDAQMVGALIQKLKVFKF